MTGGREIVRTSDMVEIRVFLPRKIVRRLNRKVGTWGNSQSEVCRYIITSNLAPVKKGVG